MNPDNARLTFRNTKFVPRKWQTEALTEWLKEYKGIIKVVTGGGKTIFALTCILEFIKQYHTGKVLIVVPTISLLDQWYLNILENLNINKSDISIFSGEEKSENFALINLAVINSAREFATEFSKKYHSFLIVDECHRAGSPENSKILLGENQATLGLSATPERDYDTGFEDLLIPHLGEIIFRYTYVDALRDKVITPFQLINVRIDLMPNEREDYEALSRKIAFTYQEYKKDNINPEKLKILLQKRASISSNAIMRIPVTAKIAELEPNSRTIIFHERINAANKIYDILNARKHNVTLYHTKVDPIIRRDNLKLFRSGVFNILLTCRALDEGMDVPETSIAIISASTAAIRQRIQRLGRVLRPAQSKTSAKIYTLYATENEEKKLYKESDIFNGISTVSWMEGMKY